MRKYFVYFFLFFLSSLVAQETSISNFGPAFVKGHQENDLYEIEIKRAAKRGYAVQVASLSSYPSVVRYVTELQGKWFDNILLKLDQNANKQTIYKILLGPFSTRKEAANYQKSLAVEGYKGFVTFLAATKVVIQEPNPTQPPLVQKGPTTPVPSSYATIGEASYYADQFHGLTTAYGERYNMHDYTAAHWTLPQHTKLRVCRIDNGKCVIVRVNDRGPNPTKAIGRNGQPRIIDLSLAAANILDLKQAGIAQVRIEVVAATSVAGPTQGRPINTDILTNKGQVDTPTNNQTTNGSIYQIGEASYYADKFHGRPTASGELFNKDALTAAHWTLPFNTRIEVCNLSNNRCVRVRVNDRGPNPQRAIGRDGKPRIVDLSLIAAQQIGLIQAGVTQVAIRILE